MFSKFLDWIRGVIGKMIEESDIKNVLGIDVAISTEMADAINKWMKMYKNEADWLNDDVKSLNLPASIASEFATLVTLEMKSEITGSKRAEFLNNQYQKILANLDTYLEYANAGGGIVFKPYVVNEKIVTDIVQADSFFPTEFDGNGNCTAGVFLARKTQNDTIYTKLEYHRYDVLTKIHTITNKAFKSKTKDTLGIPTSLKDVPEWSELVEKQPILDVERPLFVYHRIPIANNIDTKSPLRCISIFKSNKYDKRCRRTIW